MSKYLKNQQRKFEEYAENYRQETNKVFRELNRQLLLFATAVISFSLFVFRGKDFIDGISIFDKHILSFIWICLGVSIICGIIQFFIDYLFFKKWTKAKFSVVEGIYTDEIKEENISQKVIEIQKDIPSESSTTSLYSQVFFLVISLVLLIYLMIKFLFL